MPRLKYEAVAADTAGNALSGATITVYVGGTTTLATIYSDEAGTSKSNPFTADLAGRFWFYVDDGEYDIKVESGANVYTLTDVTLVHPYNIRMPTGAILAYGGSTPPSGFLVCDGAAVSRTTYSALFSVIGTTFGAGDGSTTFNLPDLRGRAPIGAGQGTGLTNRVLGNMLGAETHTLTVSEMPSHSHTGSVGSHAHSIGIQWGLGGDGFSGSVVGNIVTGSGVNTTSVAPSLTINATGGGGAHNNMQPSLVVNFIIKV